MKPTDMQAKRRILFVFPGDPLGGTNTSLFNLLSLMDKRRYELRTFALYEHLNSVYDKGSREFEVRRSRLYYWLHDNWLGRKVFGFVAKVSGYCINHGWLYEREVRLLQRRYGFDVVVGFQEGMCTWFAARFDGVRKVAWYHAPYGWPLTHDLEGALRLYSQFDAVACVSKFSVKMFSDALPSLAGRAHCVYNTLDDAGIRCMAEEPVNDAAFDTSVFTVVSLGRFDRQKQFERIPELVHAALRAGCKCDFKWYVLAPLANGNSERKTVAGIKKYGLQDKIKLIGARANPYPYIKKADLVVCTSESESFSYVINEGKALHTPVLSNSFPVAGEVLEKECGWVCGMDAMPALLSKIIDDENGIYSKVKASIANYEYSNDDILAAVDRVLLGVSDIHTV